MKGETDNDLLAESSNWSKWFKYIYIYIFDEEPIVERERRASVSTAERDERGENHGRWSQEGERDEEMKRGESMGDKEREIASSRHTWSWTRGIAAGEDALRLVVAWGWALRRRLR